MHDKINKMIWGLVLLLLFFFTFLGIYNHQKLQSYQVILNETTEVKFYTKSTKKIAEVQKKLQKESNKEELVILKNCSKILEENNIFAYFIHVGDYVKTGKHYDNGKYQVAVTDRMNQVFKILELENEVVYSKNVFGKPSFDRLIVIGTEAESVTKFTSKLSQVSLEEGKKLAKEQQYTVYWLKGNQKVSRFLAKEK